MRRVLPVAVAAAALCFSQLPASTAAAPVSGQSASLPTVVAAIPAGVSKAAAPRNQKKKPRIRTQYALFGSAYGSRVEGGSIPASSSDTAFQRIGCTNVVGQDRNNFVADQVLPGVGKAEGIRSRVWTEKKDGQVSVFSRHSIARLVIGNEELGSLEIFGLTSVVHAFNKDGKYGTAFHNEIGRIVFRLAGQPIQQLPIPAPNRTLTIPGLAKISLGKSNRRATQEGARVSANVLDITVIPLGTRARVAQSNATIQGGIKQGVFRGYAAGVEARGLADNLRIGRTPLSTVPCRGTLGKLNAKRVAGVNLGPLGTVDGVASGVKTRNQALVATGSVAGTVADISLLGGRVQVKGITGIATVKRERGVLSRSSKGSTILEVTIDGEAYSFPAIGAIEIPGLIKLEDAVETKTKNGLRVIGLRITLLDGTGAVIDLGVAEIGIRPGVRPRR